MSNTITSIADFPVLESTQFQFVSTNPLNSALVRMTSSKDIQKKFQTTKPDKWTREMNLSRILHSNPAYAPVISQEAITKFGHEKAINAFRFLTIFIRQVRIRPIDRVAIIFWFLEEGLVDINQTILNHKIELPS